MTLKPKNSVNELRLSLQQLLREIDYDVKVTYEYVDRLKGPEDTIRNETPKMAN